MIKVAAGSATVGSAGPLDGAIISEITKKLIKYWCVITDWLSVKFEYG